MVHSLFERVARALHVTMNRGGGGSYSLSVSFFFFRLSESFVSYESLNEILEQIRRERFSLSSRKWDLNFSLALLLLKLARAMSHVWPICVYTIT